MAEISLGTARPDIRRFFLQAMVVFIAYYVAGKLGQATTEIRSSNIGPVWPAYGVALAAVVLCGYRIWPVLLAAAFLIASQGSVPALTALGQAAGAVLAAATGWFLLNRAGFDPSMSRLRDVLSLIALGALVSAVVSSSVGVVVLYVSGLEGYSGIAREWFVYWLGDATGVLLITPLVFAGPRFLTLAARPVRAAEFAALVALLMLASLAIFETSLHVPPLLLLPFVIWASLRFGVGGSALTTLIVATIATIATALGHSPFAQYTTFTNAMLLDAFFATLGASGLMLASLIAEREKVDAERERLIRKQATMEARLRLAAIVESSDDAIVGQDIDGIVTDWNAAAARLYGYSQGEAIGSIFSALVRSDTGRENLDFTKNSDLVNKHETVHIKKDGTRIEVLVTMSPIHDAAGHVVGISAIVHDITERQRAASALRESEDKLRLILNSAAEGLFGIDVEGRCTFCNPAALRLLGYESEAALVGKDMHALIHHSRPDGTPFPKEECGHLSNLLETAGGIQDDDVFWRADGTSFHAELWAQSQRREGRVVGAVVAFSDITQRLQSEADAAVLRDELAHLSRVGMLGALSGTLAHEINQPLAAVRINAEAALQLLEARPLPLQVLREALTDIRDDNQRAGNVLQHMRTLLKKNPARREEVEVNSTLDEVVKLIGSNALRRGILVDVDLSPWMRRPILGDRVQIQQVMLNLLMNAFDAVENNQKGLRRVSVKTIPHRESAVIEVEDEGTGLTEEELAHIFEPFYTTKRDGLGLGLSICQSIVAAHGGRLDAARNLKGGMTFSATFPIDHAAAAQTREDAAATQATHTSQ
ncbi:MAG TPA: PAS domain S-box protein [Rhizomicrobium sp.]